MKPPATIIVGIAGGTGSGKTTIARRIVEALPPGTAILLDHDSYYKDLSHLPLEERAKQNFDHPNALDNALLIHHLKELRAGRGIQKPRYDFKTHARLPQTEWVEWAPVVVLEGILILADPEIRALLDMKVFVDTDADIRVFRRIRRDMRERGRTFEAIRQQYYSTVRPMHLQFVEPSKRWADIIVPEGGHNTVALETLLSRLRHFLEENG